METRPLSSPAAILGRLTWIFVGPVLLTVLLLFIALEGRGWLTTPDLLFFAVLAGMLLGRWVEFRTGDATTGMGEPATARHLARYLAGAVLLGLGAWVLANLIGNHWLTR